MAWLRVASSPRRASAPHAAANASGVASERAQGHETTRTAITVGSRRGGSAHAQ